MRIILVHESKRHDHGESLTVEVFETFCEGVDDGNKEYIKTDKGIFERYSCYSIISPYGWEKSEYKF